MALTRVQVTPKVGGTASIAVTFSSQPVIGNAIIFPVSCWDGTAGGTCTDNQGNDYIRVDLSRGVDTPGTTHFLCPKIVATGTPFIVTAVTSNWKEGAAIEVSGVGDLGLAVDGYSFASGSSTAPASGSTTALVADEVFVVGNCAARAAQASITVAGSWTQEYESLVITYVAGEADSKIVSSASGTTTSINWTLISSTTWTATVVAYKATSAGAGIDLITSGSIGLAPTGGTITSFNTTGADLIVIGVSSFNGGGTPVVTDSKSNTYTGLTVRTATSSIYRIFYKLAPSVGSGHTVTISGTNIYCSVQVYAFSGVAAYDGQESGNTSTSSPLACGSVTPSTNGALIFTGLSGNSNATYTAPSGFIRGVLIPYRSSNHQEGITAYLIQIIAAAIDPTWTWVSGTNSVAIACAVFTPSIPVVASESIQFSVVRPE